MLKINCLLADDHSEIDDLINEALAALDCEDVELSYKKLDFFWARLAMHIRAEHLHLFPAILRAARRSEQAKESRAPSFEFAQSTIAKLHDDHDFFMRELTTAIKQMRVLRENKSEDAANRLSPARETIFAVKRRLEAHNELEESEVYRWVDTLLNPSERVSLNERMQKEIDNLPPRFGKSEEVF